MSGTAEDDRAGLYALGALGAEEMRALHLEAERDPEFAAEIVLWERRLVPLTALVPRAALPDSIWPLLDARLNRLTQSEPMADGRAMGEIYQPPLRRRRGRRGEMRALTYWRAAALASMALAAGLLALLVRNQPEKPPQLAMVMPAQPGLGGWLIEMRPGGLVHVVSQGALSHKLTQDFQLWALADGADHPVPLGLLPVTADARFKATSPLPRRKFTLLVSLEPKGGSPTGLPSGPVLYESQVVTR